MNSIYETFQRLNSGDAISIYKNLKLNYGFDENKVQDLITSLSSILNDNPDISDKIMVGLLNEEELIAALTERYKFNKIALEHSRRADSIGMLRNMSLYDGLEDLYSILQKTDNITEEMFAFVWSTALTKNSFLDKISKKTEKKENNVVSN